MQYDTTHLAVHAHKYRIATTNLIKLSFEPFQLLHLNMGSTSTSNDGLGGESINNKKKKNTSDRTID